jgi:hypothetical protein
MSKDTLIIDAGEDTPLVSMKKKGPAGSMLIKGISMPENPLEFYSPLTGKISGFFEDAVSDLSLEIDLVYINSMSNKQILKMIRNLSGRNGTLKVTWKYQPNDDLMKTKGEEIKAIFPQLDLTVTESPDNT